MKVSKRNIRGVILLIFCSVLVIVFPRLYMYLFSQEPFSITFNKEEVYQANSDLKKEVEKRNAKKKTYVNKRNKKTYNSPPEKFNPNLYTKKEWMNLGLSEKQVNVILKFSKRGLKGNDDLKKIFVIPDILFDKIKDSTFYPVSNNSIKASFVEEKIQIDLNSASFEELKELNGIGDFYAKKIIEYRNELGGYLNKEQLLEIWKFDKEKLNQIQEDIFLSGEINRININTVTVDELKIHPYISYSIANSIVKMRKQNPYKSIEDIKRSKLIDTDTFNKIKPYLVCQ